MTLKELDFDLRKIGDSCGHCSGNLSEMFINGQKAESVMICEYCDHEDDIVKSAKDYIDFKIQGGQFVL